jgi:16S rRNA (guanine966-N2)-methyltransferase
MRIIGGEARGRRLKAPRGRGTRPTANRTREALFDLLAPRVPGSRFLDLFAGAGAIGLEALSRGAERVVMVESNERAAKVIEENAAALGGRGRVDVIRGKAMPAVRGLGRAGAKFDVVFMDPPYRDRSGLQRTLEEVARPGGILAPGAVVVVEHDAHREPLAPTGILGIERSRRFGDAVLTFFRPIRAEENDNAESSVSGQL